MDSLAVAQTNFTLQIGAAKRQKPALSFMKRGHLWAPMATVTLQM